MGLGELLLGPGESELRGAGARRRGLGEEPPHLARDRRRLPGVEVTGTVGRRTLQGRGYVEMTGYAGTMQGVF